MPSVVALVALAALFSVLVLRGCERPIRDIQAVGAADAHDAAALVRVLGRCGDRDEPDLAGAGWRPAYFDTPDVPTPVTVPDRDPAPSFTSRDLVDDGELASSIIPADLSWSTEHTAQNSIVVTVEGSTAEARASLVVIAASRPGGFDGAGRYRYALVPKGRRYPHGGPRPYFPGCL